MLACASIVLLAWVQLTVSLSAATAANGDQIIAWGNDFFGEVSGTPSGTGFTAIAGGKSYSLALAADGSIAGGHAVVGA